MNDLQFEVGKCYRTRDGHKATVMLIRPGYMIGEVQGIDGPIRWWPSGRIRPGHEGTIDLVAEWQDQVRVRVTMARHRVSGYVRVFKSDELPIPWIKEFYDILDTFELVEGEGTE